jgi:hypothetical protein
MSEEFKKSTQPFEQLLLSLKEDEARRLSQCLEEINHRLLDCRNSLEEHRRMLMALRGIDSSPSRLAAEPLSVIADEAPAADLRGTLKRRMLDHFKSKWSI